LRILVRIPNDTTGTPALVASKEKSEMLPRVAADWRALFWAFVAMPAIAVLQYARPSLAGWLLPLSLYLAYSAGVLAHNHNHCPVFPSRRMNAVYGMVLSFFYGYPTFGWIPTHNENHHRFTDVPAPEGRAGDPRAGDVTATSRHSARGSLRAAFTYPFASAMWQMPLVAGYLRRVRGRSRRAWLGLMATYVVVFGGHALALAFAVHRFGVGRGAFVYLAALGLPAGASLWGIMFTNYVQHIECDLGSRRDHSRNFVSPWMNFLVFDNGFHTVHHDRPGLHWSRLREAHQAIAHEIAPHLQRSSIHAFVLTDYVIAPLRRRLATRRLVTSG